MENSLAPEIRDVNTSSERRCCIYLLLAAVIYVVGFTLALPFCIDEAYTANLARDSSLPHMLSALKAGADGSFPLYASFAFAWAKLFGASELSLRLTSGLFAVAFVWLVSRRLKQRFTIAASALAILLIAANEKFSLYVIQGRFYGLLIFAASLAFWSTWDLIDREDRSRRRWLCHFLSCGLLWSSHPLGAVYASILALLYLGFSIFRRTFSFARVTAFAGGPIFLLPWLPSFLSQRKINPVFPPELQLTGWQRWEKFWEYTFLDSATLGIACGVGILVLIGGLRGNHMRSGSAESRLIKGDRRRGLVLYAAAFLLLLNGVIAMLDATGLIQVYFMTAVRYVLVGVVAYAVLLAAMIEGVGRMVCRSIGERARHVLHGVIALVAFFSMYDRWSDCLETKSQYEPNMMRAMELAEVKGLEVLCESHIDAFFLKTRRPNKNAKYLLQEEDPYRVLLLQIEKYYPNPIPLNTAEFLGYPRSFVFISLDPSGRREAVIVNTGEPRNR